MYLFDADPISLPPRAAAPTCCESKAGMGCSCPAFSGCCCDTIGVKRFAPHQSVLPRLNGAAAAPLSLLCIAPSGSAFCPARDAPCIRSSNGLMSHSTGFDPLSCARSISSVHPGFPTHSDPRRSLNGREEGALAAALLPAPLDQPSAAAPKAVNREKRKSDRLGLEARLKSSGVVPLPPPRAVASFLPARGGAAFAPATEK